MNRTLIKRLLYQLDKAVRVNDRVAIYNLSARLRHELIG